MSAATYKHKKATHTKPFPDHCEKNASARMMRMRRRFPGVRSRLVHPTFAATSRSNAIAVLISSNSYSTSGSCLRCRRQRQRPAVGGGVGGD